VNVACPECRTVFRVDPDRVPDPGVRARCSVCGGIITIAAERSWADDFAAEPTAQPVETSPCAPEPSPYASTEESREATIAATAAQSHEEVAHSDAAATSGPPAESTPEPVVAEQPAAEAAAREAPPASPSAPRAPIAAGRMARPTPPRVPPFSPARRMAPPAMAQPRAPLVQRSAPDVSRGSAPTAVESERVATAPAPTPAPTSPTPAAMSTPVGGAERRPINPFLANDPNAKARRLARALVSDMIAYHPQKREDGLRAGTLKQLFRDEIRKSYEEYVEQVGQEFAESTSHFQDALNDVLAGGKKIF
jgi:predicted Zn finger-like uncharacterized protein